MIRAIHELDHIGSDVAFPTQPRSISPADMRRFEGYMAEIFTAMGIDTHSPATRNTAQRYVRALFDATAGYDGDPKVLTLFDNESANAASRLSQVIEGPIRFYALCEHHALPFHGRAYIGYVAGRHIIGISKLTRIVRLFARRFTVQERLTEQLADALDGALQPHGVAVLLEAHHLCMQMRGVEEPVSLTRTSAWRGAYAADALRSEFLMSCRGSG